MRLYQIKSSFRFLFKRKTYFFINIVGLGIGIASFIFLYLYVRNDFTFDHFNKNYPSIYRVTEFDGLHTKGPLLPVLLDEIPEVENGTRIFNWEAFRMSYGNMASFENIHYVDSGFFNIFSFRFIEGNEKKALTDKYDVVISKDFASKYFGDAEALGKQLRIGFDNTFLNVSGVVEIPENSSIKFDILTTYETGETLSPWIKDVHDWYNTFSETYVLLKRGVDPKSLYPKFGRIVKENFIPVGKNETELKLLPLAELHSKQASNRPLIIILAIVALGIIAIGVINFINLTLAASLTRNREMGVKKVMGVRKNQLFGQLMTESLIISFFAVVFGVALACLALPLFNEYFDTHLKLNFRGDIYLPAVLFSIWIGTGVISGFVPSFFWGQTKLVNALKGEVQTKSGRSFSRYSLMIFQFVITIILSSGAFFIRKQVNYMMSKDAHFDKENVVVAQLNSWQYEDPEIASRKFNSIAEQLKEDPRVLSISFSAEVPGQYTENYNSFFPDEGSSDIESVSLRQAYVSEGYFETYGIKLIEGRAFDPAMASDSNAIIINKTAMDKFGWDSAVGKVLHNSFKDGYPHQIIGVVEDFQYQGYQKEIQPLIHFFQKREQLAYWNCLSVRSQPGAIVPVVDLLKRKWQEISPAETLDFFFARDKINDFYKQYTNLNALVGYFSLLAIALCCMGLFSIASFITVRKTKEIGVRKVNGAKVWEVVFLLNKNFIKWVLIAFSIAVPLAWYAIIRWLESFAYKTEISWWIFVLSGILALGIALLTVSWQSWKAATRNPVEALRYE